MDITMSHGMGLVARRWRRAALVALLVAGVTVAASAPATAGPGVVAGGGIPAGFPTASTTGFVGAGLSLSDLSPSGNITITTDGAVIDRVDVSGLILVEANNVTIRRSRVRHSDFIGIRLTAGHTGLVIEDTQIIGTSSGAGAGIGYADWTCRRCDISGAADGAKGSRNVLLEDSYIHDLRVLPGTHNDGFQSTGGANVTIRHNSIFGPFQFATSAIIIQSEPTRVSNNVVEGNYLYGGAYNIYLWDKSGSGQATNSVIRNNVFAAGTTMLYRDCIQNGKSPSQCNKQDNIVRIDGSVTVAGNVWHTGDPLGSSGGPFADVPLGQFYTTPVTWMAEQGLTTGTSPSTFHPHNAITRAEFATFLYRYAGKPSRDHSNDFVTSYADLEWGEFYSESVEWLLENGLSSGRAPGIYEPDGTLTRGEAAAFLWRFECAPNTGGSSGFADVPAAAFYADAVAWMVASGITTGRTSTIYDPAGAVTRAEIATFLWRLAGQPSPSSYGSNRTYNC